MFKLVGISEDRLAQVTGGGPVGTTIPGSCGVGGSHCTESFTVYVPSKAAAVEANAATLLSLTL